MFGRFEQQTTERNAMNDFYLASYDDPIPHSDELTFDAVIAVPSSTEEGSRPKDKPRPERVTTELSLDALKPASRQPADRRLMHQFCP